MRQSGDCLYILNQKLIWLAVFSWVFLIAYSFRSIETDAGRKQTFDKASYLSNWIANGRKLSIVAYH